MVKPPAFSAVAGAAILKVKNHCGLSRFHSGCDRLIFLHRGSIIAIDA